MVNWSKFIGCPQHVKPAMRGKSSVDLPTLDSVARSGWVVSVTPRPLCRKESDPIPIVNEDEWAGGRSGQVRKISSPHRSETLHRSFFKTRTNSSVTTRNEGAVKQKWQNNTAGQSRSHSLLLQSLLLMRGYSLYRLHHRPLLSVILIHNVPIITSVKRLCD